MRSLPTSRQEHDPGHQGHPAVTFLEPSSWDIDELKFELEELILEDAPIEVTGFSPAVCRLPHRAGCRHHGVWAFAKRLTSQPYRSRSQDGRQESPQLRRTRMVEDIARGAVLPDASSMHEEDA